MRKSSSNLFRPAVEQLGDRLVPTVYVVGGHVLIYGTGGNDDVWVDHYGPDYKVYEGTKGTVVPAAQFTGEILFKGFGGHDRFTNNTARRSIAYGGDGNDTLTGGAGVDKFYGEAGNDTLSGGAGADELDGGAGNDWMSAGADVDTAGNYLDGGSGNDTMLGGAGADNMFGGTGNDRMYGRAGDDALNGGGGDDKLNGGDGNDLLFGNGGYDQLSGGDGNDRLDGGVDDGHSDYLAGGTGADLFRDDPWHWYNYLPPYKLSDYNADFNAAEGDLVYI